MRAAVYGQKCGEGERRKDRRDGQSTGKTSVGPRLIQVTSWWQKRRKMALMGDGEGHVLSFCLPVNKCGNLWRKDD